MVMVKCSGENCKIYASLGNLIDYNLWPRFLTHKISEQACYVFFWIWKLLFSQHVQSSHHIFEKEDRVIWQQLDVQSKKPIPEIVMVLKYTSVLIIVHYLYRQNIFAKVVIHISITALRSLVTVCSILVHVLMIPTALAVRSQISRLTSHLVRRSKYRKYQNNPPTTCHFRWGLMSFLGETTPH